MGFRLWLEPTAAIAGHRTATSPGPWLLRVIPSAAATTSLTTLLLATRRRDAPRITWRNGHVTANRLYNGPRPVLKQALGRQSHWFVLSCRGSRRKPKKRRYFLRLTFGQRHDKLIC